MKCVEFFYTEKGAKDFKKVLENENFEEIVITKIKEKEENTDIPYYAWEVSWKPKHYNCI